VIRVPFFSVKEKAANTHKWLCNVYGTAEVDRSTIGHWTKRVRD
jgi:hypothetical protein